MVRIATRQVRIITKTVRIVTGIVKKIPWEVRKDASREKIVARNTRIIPRIWSEWSDFFLQKF